MPCASLPSTSRETSGCTRTASSRATSPAAAVARTVTMSAEAGKALSSVRGRRAPGATESPWGPIESDRIAPSRRFPALNAVRAELSGRRSTTGITRERGWAPSASVSLPWSASSTYPEPSYWASPVHKSLGATAVAPAPSVPSSAWTYCVPTMPCTSEDREAMRRTEGWASRASMVSRPWIVDSAPEFRLTVPSSAMPSIVTPFAGS